MTSSDEKDAGLELHYDYGMDVDYDMTRADSPTPSESTSGKLTPFRVINTQRRMLGIVRVLDLPQHQPSGREQNVDLEDVLLEDDLPIPDTEDQKTEQKQKQTRSISNSLIACLLVMLSLWTSKFGISMHALAILLKALHWFTKQIRLDPPFPASLYQYQACFATKDSFTRYVRCKKCHQVRSIRMLSVVLT